MKHTDFIRSLRTIKNHIIHSQEKPRKITLEHKKKNLKSDCTCTDSNGETKYLYHSQQEIEYILASKQVSLTSYPCPYERGWHITKG